MKRTYFIAYWTIFGLLCAWEAISFIWGAFDSYHFFRSQPAELRYLPPIVLVASIFLVIGERIWRWLPRHIQRALALSADDIIFALFAVPLACIIWMIAWTTWAFSQPWSILPFALGAFVAAMALRLTTRIVGRFQEGVTPTNSSQEPQT